MHLDRVVGYSEVLLGNPDRGRDEEAQVKQEFFSQPTALCWGDGEFELLSEDPDPFIMIHGLVARQAYADHINLIPMSH